MMTTSTIRTRESSVPPAVSEDAQKAMFAAVQTRLAEVREAARRGDYELARELEKYLWLEGLVAIKEGAPEPVRLAAMATETLLLDLERR